MPIHVQWQNERGEPMAVYIGHLPDRRLSTNALPGSICVRFIDPYGDTTFNCYQVSVLERELQDMASHLEDQELTQQVKGLLQFVREFPERTHMYLKFIGD